MAHNLVKEKPFKITLPCGVGDTVYCNIDGHAEDYLNVCTVDRIELCKDYKEPLFTVVCHDPVEYQTFWLSDFGKLVITEATYINMEPREIERFYKNTKGGK